MSSTAHTSDITEKWFTRANRRVSCEFDLHVVWITLTQLRGKHASQGPTSCIELGELEARGIKSLTRFPRLRKLCQDTLCHYDVMKIYKGDSRLTVIRLFRYELFPYSVRELVQRASSFTAERSASYFQ